MDHGVYSLTVDSSGNLYAAANYIAKWNGSAWSSLGWGMDNGVYALAVDSSGNLYAGGDFTSVDGKLSPYIAKCDLTTGETTTTTVFPGCPAQKVLEPDNPQLESLRAFRDSALARSAPGRRLISLYYTHADGINSALERSPALRAVARRVLEIIMPLAVKKE